MCVCIYINQFKMDTSTQCELQVRNNVTAEKERRCSYHISVSTFSGRLPVSMLDTWVCAIFYDLRTLQARMSHLSCDLFIEISFTGSKHCRYDTTAGRSICSAALRRLVFIHSPSLTDAFLVIYKVKSDCILRSVTRWLSDYVRHTACSTETSEWIALLVK